MRSADTPGSEAKGKEQDRQAQAPQNSSNTEEPSSESQRFISLKFAETRSQRVQGSNETEDDEIEANDELVESEVDAGNQRTDDGEDDDDGGKNIADVLFQIEELQLYQIRYIMSTRTETTPERVAATAASVSARLRSEPLDACALASSKAVMSWLTSVSALTELAGVFVLRASEEQNNVSDVQPQEPIAWSYGAGT